MDDAELPATRGDRMPNTYDYLAGAMLANGIIWVWNQALGAFRGFFSKVPAGILADLSYVIYLAAALIASMMVCGRASRGHLVVGAKFAGFGWVLFIIILVSMPANPTLGMVASMLLIFATGGVVGAYITVRRRMKTPEKIRESS